MEKFRNLFLNRRTIMHLLETRDYNIKDSKRNFENYELFQKKYSEYIQENDLDGLKQKFSGRFTANDGSKTIYVWFSSVESGTKSTGKSIMQRFLQEIEENDADTGIIIIDIKFASEAGKEFENAKKRIPGLQFFLADELYSTIIHHVLVPKHELVTPEEKPILIKEMKLRHPDDMEFILNTDPVVKFYGWSVGDMIRIHRNNDFVDILTPLTYGYRVVKKAP